jgi:hypothetical protein
MASLLAERERCHLLGEQEKGTGKEEEGEEKEEKEKGTVEEAESEFHSAAELYQRILNFQKVCYRTKKPR